MQLPERVALGAPLVKRPRLREHMLAIEMRERLDLAVERLDTRETGARIGLAETAPAAISAAASLAVNVTSLSSAMLSSCALVWSAAHPRACERVPGGICTAEGSWYICAVTGMPWVRAAPPRSRGSSRQGKGESRARQPRQGHGRECRPGQCRYGGSNLGGATVRLKYSISMRSKAVATSRRVQYAALPYKPAAAGPEVMLVTSRGKQRWIIPKGWPHGGRAPCDLAAREAFEEAGVLGAVGRRSVGSFRYKKRLKKGRVAVFNVHVFPRTSPVKGSNGPRRINGTSSGSRSKRPPKRCRTLRLGKIILRWAQIAACSRKKGPAAPCHYPGDTSAQEIELARAAVKQECWAGRRRMN